MQYNISKNPTTTLSIYTDTSLQTTKLNLSLLLLLSLSFNLLMQLACLLALKLVGTTDGNVLGTEVTEEVLEDVFNQPAATVVKDHQHSQGHLELVGEGHETQLLVQLGDELGGAGECDRRGANKTPVHRLVLANRLTEGTALVVDREGGDLLDQLEEVDGTVQEGGLKLALEINIGFSPVSWVSYDRKDKGHPRDVRFMFINVVRQVDQSHNMDSKLPKNRSNDVDVEDVWLGTLLRQTFDRLNAPNNN